MRKIYLGLVTLLISFSFSAGSANAGAPISWSDLASPSNSLTLPMNNSNTMFTWGNATGASNLFTLTDTANNTGTGYLLNVASVTGSTENPFHVKAGATDALTVLANGKVGIGTATPLTALTVMGSAPIISLKNKNLGGEEYQLRNGSLTGGSFDIYDKTSETTRFGISGLGNVSIGAPPIDEARLFILGNQSNGANFDLRAANTFSAATIETQADDYNTSFQASYIQYIGSGIPGNLIGNVPRADAGTLVFQGAANGVIYTIGSAPLILGTNNTERIRITNSGSVGIGTTTPQAALDVSSTTSGFLPPRMTASQRDKLSGAVEGLMIYNLTEHKLNVYNGSIWETVQSSPAQSATPKLLK